MNTVEILKKAKERIGTPDRWHQGGPCDIGGSYIPASGNDDCACCALGAMSYALSKPFVYSCSIPYLSDHVPSEFMNIAVFNDCPTTTHADIMALFDRAIAAAEAGQ